MKKYGLLWIAFLEGFTTLAFQMVALRKAIPFVGSSIVLTSIVIGVILLALSAGYFAGGKLTSALSEKQLLRRLQVYLLIAALYYLLIVYPSFSWVVTQGLNTIGYIPTLFLFAIVFFAIPTFLASHTMPIITHVTQGTKGYAAGKILFISTLGSFLGSTITTLVLFPQLGVYRSGILSSLILIVCSLLVYLTSKEGKTIYAAMIFLFLITSVRTRPVVDGYFVDTPYQTIQVIEGNTTAYPDGPIRVLQMNGGRASGIYTQTKKSFFSYIRAMVEVIHAHKPATVAVIGAAGCTLPQEIAQLNFVKQIDVVDIDPAVFHVAQEQFLQEPLHSKIIPIVQSARGRVYDKIKAGKQYDMLIVDVYNGISLPDEVLTREFFAGLRRVSDHVILNIITDRSLASPFSQSLLATLQSARGDVYYRDTTSAGRGDEIGNLVISNMAESGYTLAPTSHAVPYTDDRNNADELRVQVMYGK